MEKNLLKKDIIYKCKHCNKEFSRTKRKKDDCLFCCRKCADEYKKTITQQKKEEKQNQKIKEVECNVCNKIFTTKIKNVKYCSKECREEAGRIKSREKSKQRRIDNFETKTIICVCCGEEFITKIKKGSSTKICCKQCKDNVRKEKRKEYKKYLNHKRRIKIKGVAIEKVYRKVVFERDNWTCKICGKTVDKDMKWDKNNPSPTYPTIDHIIPISKGGTHTYKNIQTACFKCNSLKSDK